MNLFILIFLKFIIIFGFSNKIIASCRINVAVQSIMPTKDPLKAVSWWEKREATLQFDTLLRFNESGEVEPWLARKWQFSKDLKKLTIDLRPGVKFTDGSEIDSNDVIKSLKRFIGPESIDHGRLSYIKKITYINKQRLEINLSHPFIPLLYYLATPRSGIVKVLRKTEIIGSGPWIFFKSDTNNSKKVQLWKANENYFNGAPLCKELGLIEIPTNELADSFRSNFIDLIEYYPTSKLVQKDFKQVFGSNSEIQNFPSYDVTALFFSEKTKSPIEKSSRRELYQIIAEEFNTQDLSFGYSKVCSILPYGMSLNRSEPCISKKSKNLIINPKTFTIHTQNDERWQILKKIAEIAKKQSFILNFKFSTLAEMYAKHGKGDINIHIETLTMQIPEAYGVLSMFESSSGENFSKYSNFSFDNLLNKAKSEKDFAKRKEYYLRAEDILLKDAIVIPLVHQSRVSIFSKKISGYNSNSIGPFYASYDKILKKEE